MKKHIKNRKHKNFTLKHKGISTPSILHNASIFSIVCVLAFLLLILAAIVHSQDQVDLSANTDILKPHTETQEPIHSVLSERGGEGFVDGSLHVFGTNYNNVVDLVEISTPVTPAANHVRLFAVASGTFTTIKALFDDGTVKTLANN